MRVLKRSGDFENVKFDKITARLNKLKTLKVVGGYTCANADTHKIAQKVCESIYDGVHTSELDNHAARIAGSMIVQHEDYGSLGARILISNLQKEFGDISFLDNCVRLSENGILDTKIVEIVRENEKQIEEAFDHNREFLYDYFGAQTLISTYLTKCNGKIVERPSYFWMRVALGIHYNDIPHAIESYKLMSQKFFTHATPTLFAAGTKNPQLSSCFLLTTKGDSIEGMYSTVKDCAVVVS